MLTIGSIVWGVRDLERGIEFWSNALGYGPRDEPDDDWVILAPHDGAGPQLALSLVSSAASMRRRHHLDLYADNQSAEVARLVNLGAQRVAWDYEDGADYVVLEDPDGNRFCVIEASEQLARASH